MPHLQKKFSLSTFTGACTAGSVMRDARVGRGLCSVIREDPGSIPIAWPHSQDTLPLPFSTLHLNPYKLPAAPAWEVSACSCLILPPCLPTQNLRVRSSGGTEFFTRSATKFKGVLAQKFMFVDGDRAVCGSYR